MPPNAIPPPPPITDPDQVYLFGFPLPDLPATYRALIDPTWDPEPAFRLLKKGDFESSFPDLLAILEAVRRRTPPGIKVTLLEVWDARAAELGPDDDKILPMVAVASASRDCPGGSVSRSEEELAAVKHAAGVPEGEDVKPVWLLSAWGYDELKEFTYPGMV